MKLKSALFLVAQLILSTLGFTAEVLPKHLLDLQGNFVVFSNNKLVKLKHGESLFRVANYRDFSEDSENFRTLYILYIPPHAFDCQTWKAFDGVVFLDGPNKTWAGPFLTPVDDEDDDFDFFEDSQALREAQRELESIAGSDYDLCSELGASDFEQADTSELIKFKLNLMMLVQGSPLDQSKNCFGQDICKKKSVLRKANLEELSTLDSSLRAKSAKVSKNNSLEMVLEALEQMIEEAEQDELQKNLRRQEDENLYWRTPVPSPKVATSSEELDEECPPSKIEAKEKSPIVEQIEVTYFPPFPKAKPSPVVAKPRPAPSPVRRKPVEKAPMKRHFHGDYRPSALDPEGEIGSGLACWFPWLHYKGA